MEKPKVSIRPYLSDTTEKTLSTILQRNPLILYEKFEEANILTLYFHLQIWAEADDLFS